MIRRVNRESNDYGYVGIKFPMNSRDPKIDLGIFNRSISTEDQSVSNFINLLLTKPGERYMQPGFGVGLQLYLFEQNVLEFQELLEVAIVNQSSIWLPYIDIKNISINGSFVDNQDNTDSLFIPGSNGFNTPSMLENSFGHDISITITFSVGKSGANKTISFFSDQSGILYNITEA